MDFDPETIRQFELGGRGRAAPACVDVFAQAGGTHVDALPDSAAIVRGAGG